MRKYRKILLILAAAVLAMAMFAFTACGDNDETKITVSLDKPTLTLNAGASAMISATVEGSDDEVEWTATPDDESVITITGNGKTCKVTAVAEGTAKVTATVGDQSAECTVTVSPLHNDDDDDKKDDDDDKKDDDDDKKDDDDDKKDDDDDKKLPNITEWETVVDAIYGEVTENGGDYIWHHIFFNDAVEQEYDFDSYEATVTLDGAAGEVVTCQAFNGEAAAAHTYHMQIRIKGNRYQTTVFTINFKKGGETVATGTYTREGDREIVLNSGATLSISKGLTDTVSITSVNGSTELSGLTIAWTIEDTEGTGVATIPENSSGTSVVVTAAKEGKATLTCTIGEGNDAFSKTCVITVVEGDVVITAVDVSSQYNFNNKFEYDGDEAIQVFFNLQGEAYKDLVQDIDPDQTTVEVKMDGDESTCRIPRKEWQGVGDYNLWVQVAVKGDWSHDYEFKFSFKNARGQEVAYATHEEIAPKTLTLSAATLNLKLDGETTGTVTATVSNKVEGKVSWEIDDESVATIVASEDGSSVTVTAVADGTAIITATVDGLEQKCKVTVGEVQAVTITVFEMFDGPYGDGKFYKFRVKSTDPNAGEYADVKAGFDHTNVNGTATDHIEFVAEGDTGNYILGVHFPEVAASGTAYKIDLCDASGTILATLTWTPA